MHTTTATLRGNFLTIVDCPVCHFYKNNTPGEPCRMIGCFGTQEEVTFVKTSVIKDVADSFTPNPYVQVHDLEASAYFNGWDQAMESAQDRLNDVLPAKEQVKA